MAYFANIRIRIISAFFLVKQKKECTILAIKQLPFNPKSIYSEVIGYFEEVFLKTATKTYPFVCDEFLTFRPLTEEPGNYFPWNCLVTKLWTFHKRSNAFCKENELKLFVCLTLLSGGLTGFWLCESLDSVLPISR